MHWLFTLIGKFDFIAQINMWSDHVHNRSLPAEVGIYIALLVERCLFLWFTSNQLPLISYLIILFSQCIEIVPLIVE